MHRLAILILLSRVRSCAPPYVYSSLRSASFAVTSGIVPVISLLFTASKMDGGCAICLLALVKGVADCRRHRFKKSTSSASHSQSKMTCRKIIVGNGKKADKEKENGKCATVRRNGNVFRIKSLVANKRE